MQEDLTREDRERPNEPHARPRSFGFDEALHQTVKEAEAEAWQEYLKLCQHFDEPPKDRRDEGTGSLRWAAHLDELQRRSQPLAWLGQRIRGICQSKGFDTPRSISQTNDVLAKLMLITTEVAEAAEAVRHEDEPNFAEELADVAIRLLDLAYGMGIDLDGEVMAKMARNAQRQPMHGGKLA